MHEKVDEETPAAPRHAQLVQMAMAFWTSRLIYVAAKLGLADHLSNGPKGGDALAAPTGTHAPSPHADSCEPGYFDRGCDASL